MTNNSNHSRPALPDRIDRLTIDRIDRLSDRGASDRIDRLTDRGASGRTETTDRTLVLPDYTLNGRHANFASQRNGGLVETEDDEFTVPILPMGLAVTCGVLNFILPGLGTIIAGLCAPCCAKSELGIKDYSCVSACVIIGVGFLQLLLTACFLIGWVWSAIWGIALIGTATDFSNCNPLDPESTYWRNRPSSTRSRRSIRPRSNFIYPMRAPSNVDYNSPPPPYQMFGTPPPRYASRPSSERYRSTTASPLTTDTRRLNEASSARTMTTTQIMEDSSEVMSWDCPQCNRVYEADIRKHLCRRCSRDVCGRCYTKVVRTRAEDRVTVCDKCFTEVSQDPRLQRV